MAAAGSALMSVNEGDENSLFYDDPDLAVDDYIPKDRHDLELMRERLSKLLLGDDPSGGAKGCGPALAMANAITSVSASVFGDSLRLRPLRDEDKNKWRREMGIMVSVCRHIVELAPGWQTRPDGTRFEVRRRRFTWGAGFEMSQFEVRRRRFMWGAAAWLSREEGTEGTRAERWESRSRCVSALCGAGSWVADAP
ncbi:unnamed protein product [Closterium sp. NIES-54]